MILPGTRGASASGDLGTVSLVGISLARIGFRKFRLGHFTVTGLLGRQLGRNDLGRFGRRFMHRFLRRSGYDFARRIG